MIFVKMIFNKKISNEMTLDKMNRAVPQFYHLDTILETKLIWMSSQMFFKAIIIQNDIIIYYSLLENYTKQSLVSNSL